MSDPHPPVCSAKACRRPAAWGLRWNNPKLHPPERRKVWTACDEHRESLETFLRLRNFLRDTVPLNELGTTNPPAPPADEAAREDSGDAEEVAGGGTSCEVRGVAGGAE